MPRAVIWSILVRLGTRGGRFRDLFVGRWTTISQDLDELISSTVMGNMSHGSVDWGVTCVIGQKLMTKNTVRQMTAGMGWQRRRRNDRDLVQRESSPRTAQLQNGTRPNCGAILYHVLASASEAAAAVSNIAPVGGEVNWPMPSSNGRSYHHHQAEAIPRRRRRRRRRRAARGVPGRQRHGVSQQDDKTLDERRPVIFPERLLLAYATAAAAFLFIIHLYNGLVRGDDCRRADDRLQTLISIHGRCKRPTSLRRHSRRGWPLSVILARIYISDSAE